MSSRCRAGKLSAAGWTVPGAGRGDPPELQAEAQTKATTIETARAERLRGRRGLSFMSQSMPPGDAPSASRLHDGRGPVGLREMRWIGVRQRPSVATSPSASASLSAGVSLALEWRSNQV